MRSPRALLLLAVIGSGVALAGCTGPSASDAPSSAAADPAVASPPAATATPSASSDAVGAFEAWWTAVRASDTVAACGALTEPLQQRMIDEYTRTTGAKVDDCATLIRQSSALYAATGMSSDVSVDVVSQTTDAAELDVTYATGDCGTVHLTRTAGTWRLDELSKGCGQG